MTTDELRQWATKYDAEGAAVATAALALLAERDRLRGALEELIAETPECDDPKENPRVHQWCSRHQNSHCRVSKEILPAARAALARP